MKQYIKNYQNEIADKMAKYKKEVTKKCCRKCGDPCWNAKDYCWECYKYEKFESR